MFNQGFDFYLEQGDMPHGNSPEYFIGDLFVRMNDKVARVHNSTGMRNRYSRFGCEYAVNRLSDDLNISFQARLNMIFS